VRWQEAEIKEVAGRFSESGFIGRLREIVSEVDAA